MEQTVNDRARIDNIRFDKPGRPKGMANLAPETKAAIVLDKNLHLLSHPSIAAKHNVSRFTVANTTEENLDPEAKKHLTSFVEKLSVIREETSDLIIEKIRNKSIKDGVLPTLLNIANQNYRLETNQSTSNINIADCAQIAKQAFEIQAKLAQADQDQSPLTQAEKIAIYEEICLAQGQQPDVSLLELDSEETE